MRSVTVQVVTWNAEGVIGRLLTSLQRQTYTDWHLLVVDNASQDGTVTMVRTAFPDATVIANDTNRGFGAGHNQAFRATDTPYVAVINPDVDLAPDALASLVMDIEAHARVASVSGKVLQGQRGSTTIDAAGIVATRWHQFRNRGEGERDVGQYGEAASVFGNTGGLVLYRRTALADVTDRDEVFDEDFFAYKEDIDLAWRLLRYGWHHRYIPHLVGYHERAAKRTRTGAAIRGRGHSALVRRLSYQNHLLLLFKHVPWRRWFVPLPLTFGYEFGKLLFVLLREWRTLPGLFRAARLYPRMRRKMQRLNARAPVPQQALRHWFR